MNVTDPNSLRYVEGVEGFQGFEKWPREVTKILPIEFTENMLCMTVIQMNGPRGVPKKFSKRTFKKIIE